MERWTEEDLELVKEKYKDSKEVLLKTFPNRSYNQIKGKINDLGFRRRKNLELNRSFFSTITQESAYLLGVLEAEGSINKNKIVFGISSKDSNWFYSIVSLTGSKATVRLQVSGGFASNYPGIYIDFCSKQWVEDLDKLGFRKGHLPKIPNKYLKHYMRGYFDGDGTICWDKDNRCYISSFYGHPETLIEEIRDTINLDFQKVRKGPTCWITRGYREPTAKLIEYFPRPETYMLDRKTKLIELASKVNFLPKQQRYLHVELDGEQVKVSE